MMPGGRTGVLGVGTTRGVASGAPRSVREPTFSPPSLSPPELSSLEAPGRALSGRLVSDQVAGVGVRAFDACAAGCGADTDLLAGAEVGLAVMQAVSETSSSSAVIG